MADLPLCILSVPQICLNAHRVLLGGALICIMIVGRLSVSCHHSASDFFRIPQAEGGIVSTFFLLFPLFFLFSCSRFFPHAVLPFPSLKKRHNCSHTFGLGDECTITLDSFLGRTVQVVKMKISYLVLRLPQRYKIDFFCNCAVYGGSSLCFFLPPFYTSFTLFFFLDKPPSIIITAFLFF